MTGDGSVLITGATGILGSWMAAEALRRGRRVVALVRGDDAGAARRRLAKAMSVAGVDCDPQRVGVVLGDVRHSGLGLAGGAAGIGEVGMICHCAAVVSFDNETPELHRRTNVDGVAAVLELAESLGVGVMHVSTSYVAGKRTGIVREDELDCGQAFNNNYERTKCEGESLVHAWARRTGLPALVLRPSIVLGDSRTGRTVHFSTLYHFMRFFDGLAGGRRRDEVRVQVAPGVTKNIVPVDYVAAAAWELAARGARGVHHLTHPRPLAMEQMRTIFCRLFGTERIRLVDAASFRERPPTRLEEAFKALARSYEPYMESEPVFDRTATDAALAGWTAEPPPIDLSYLQLLTDYARQVDWGRQSAAAGATPAPPAPSAFEEYFETFLPGKMHQRLLPDLRHLSAVFRVIHAQQPHKHWTVEIKEGVLTSISRNGTVGECSYYIDAPALCEVVSGRLTPQKAFFQRRVEIEGDLETGLKVAFVLSAFFRAFPFEPGRA